MGKKCMKIEGLRLKNFKSFQDVVLKDIPTYAVFVGKNNVGKTSFFSVFGFLKDAMSANVTSALSKWGGATGFKEMRTRGCDGPIEIEIQFRPDSYGVHANKKPPLVTYSLFIDLDPATQKPYVHKEQLRYRRGSHGNRWLFLDFNNGVGQAVTNEFDAVEKESDLKREPQKLKQNDILAIKGLAQFQSYPAVQQLGELIENWHVSDLHVSEARNSIPYQYEDQLSSTGQNLSNVLTYLYQNERSLFDMICTQLKHRITDIDEVEVKTTDEGRVQLKFRNNAFEEPFLSKWVSDGTIRMLAYLVLLYSPSRIQLLSIEEPENQLYPEMLSELSEEFEAYSRRGKQVFVSTHSPDFLNAVPIDSVFQLSKNKKGYTEIKRLKEDDQVAAFVKEGDKLGYLWQQGLLGNG
jgi:predicted ATPase